MDTLRLKAFYEIMRKGTVSAAAKSMGCLQPHVSRLLKALEKDLGVVLFTRQGKKLVPTPRGKYYYKVAERLLYDIEHAQVVLDEWETEAKGYLKVLTTMGLMNVWLVHHLREFTDMYPDIKIRMMGDAMLDNSNSYSLQENDVDVAILPFMENCPDLIQEHIISFNYKPHASKDYLERFGIPKDLRDLDNHRLLAFYDKHIGKLGDIDKMFIEGMPEGKRRESFLQLGSSTALYHAALQGIGIASLTKDYGTFANSELIDIFPDYEGHTLKMYYSYPVTMKDSTRIQTFGKFLERTAKKSKKGLVSKS